jgi:hypothetical protein
MFHLDANDGKPKLILLSKYPGNIRISKYQEKTLFTAGCADGEQWSLAPLFQAGPISIVEGLVLT